MSSPTPHCAYVPILMAFGADGEDAQPIMVPVSVAKRLLKASPSMARPVFKAPPDLYFGTLSPGDLPGGLRSMFEGVGQLGRDSQPLPLTDLDIMAWRQQAQESAFTFTAKNSIKPAKPSPSASTSASTSTSASAPAAARSKPSKRPREEDDATDTDLSTTDRPRPRAVSVEDWRNVLARSEQRLPCAVTAKIFSKSPVELESFKRARNRKET